MEDAVNDNGIQSKALGSRNRRLMVVHERLARPVEGRVDEGG